MDTSQLEQGYHDKSEKGKALPVHHGLSSEELRVRVRKPGVITVGRGCIPIFKVGGNGG